MTDSQKSLVSPRGKIPPTQSSPLPPPAAHNFPISQTNSAHNLSNTVSNRGRNANVITRFSLSIVIDNSYNYNWRCVFLPSFLQWLYFVFQNVAKHSKQKSTDFAYDGDQVHQSSSAAFLKPPSGQAQDTSLSPRGGNIKVCNRKKSNYLFIAHIVRYLHHACFGHH